MVKTKNDEAWECLFEKLNIQKKIEESGSFIISSKQINDYREARLMTKFDHYSNQPKIFKDNNLSILPITRGDYIISGFDAYKQIKYNNLIPTFKDFPPDIETIDYNNLYSEASIINCAFITSMISDIIGENCMPTISGRMASTAFEFNIHNKIINNTMRVKVKNSQIEIDGGFESKNYFCIIEAKNYMTDDFIIRQLYYPYRLWKNKINKKIIPIFLAFSNNIFSFFIYEFPRVDDYNSIKLVEQKNYTLINQKINLNELKNLINSTPQMPESNIPFPQADTFERVIDLMFLLSNTKLSLEEISLNYSFDIRQAAYYCSALRYLGIAIKKSENGVTVYSLSEVGKEIVAADIKTRNSYLIKKIIEHTIFKNLLNYYLSNKKIPSKDYIIDEMKKNEIYNVSKNSSTLLRRAQTVQAWVNWVISLVEG